MEPTASLSEYLNLFSKTSTFVSLDVVGSTRLKAGENEQDIIYSFLAYHKLVSNAAYNSHGEVINITGDGMMCRFEKPEDAVQAAESVLAELPTFNKKQNHLSRPIAIRLGIHTGQVLASEAQSSGQLISQTLDIAAKLQQAAEPDHACLSEVTVTLLKDKAGSFKRLGWNAALQMNVYELKSGGPAAAGGQRKLPDPAKVLVVEQELDELARLKRALFGRHHDSFTVYTQNQAALCTAAWQPHLIMVSADLPWDTGWELLTGLRADAKISSVPIIVMSRETTGNIIQKAFRMGANGFLRKPMDEKQILKRVEIVLREFYL